MSKFILYIILNFIIVEPIFGQDENAPKINIVNYYGIHDKSTIEFLSILLRDTNNVAFMMDFNFSLFQEIKKSKDLGGLISDECNSNYNELIEFSNLYGGSISSERVISLNFSIQKIQKEINNLIDTISVGVPMKKKFYFLYSTYDWIDGTRNFINEFAKSTYDVSMFIVQKGSKKQGSISLLNFKNKIKGSEKIKPFQFLNFEDLPAKVRLDKNFKISKENLHFCKFIYVPKLENCRW